ncbi:hypothetical protein V8V88_05315 [Paenibacillus phytohabitans]
MKLHRHCGEHLDFRPLLSPDFLILNRCSRVKSGDLLMLSMRAFLRKAFRRSLPLLQFQISPPLLLLFVYFFSASNIEIIFTSKDEASVKEK